ncbi:MAG: hypothetical protein K2I06_07040 [Ruminococcus sp.]|nr:hypothetical protein [Ruminococcus sp.]
MAENSVGSISIELEIQNNTAEQLSRVQNEAEKSSRKIGESIESAVNRPIESMTESLSDRVEYAMKEIRKNLESAEISANPTERLVEGLEKVQEKIELLQLRRNELQENLENTEDNKSAQKIIEKLNQTERQLISLGNAADRYNQKINSIGENTAQTVDGQLREIFDRLNNFQTPSTPAERLQAELENTRTKIALLQRQWQELSEAEPSESIVSQMLRIQQQIVSATDSAERLERRIEEMNQADVSEPAKKFNVLNGLLSTLKITTEGIKNTVTAPVRAVVSGVNRIGQACHSAYEKLKYYLENPLYAVRDAGKAAFSVIKKSGHIAFGLLKNVGGKAIDSLKNRFGFLKKSALSLSSPIKRLGRTLKNTFRRVFVMATLYAAVKAIRNSFKDILKSNDELSKSLNEVKANLSIAFTPIIQAVMPALNTMMSGLAMTTKYIASFISGLFGMTYRQAAEATKKLHETGKKAEETAKKTTMSVAGIDEMNILSDSSDESERDSEEDSGIDYDALDLSDPVLPDWAERLKEAIKAGDWYGVGEILAERVNAVFGGIDWEKVEKKVTDGVNKICDLINGFVDNLNWEYLGNALAGGINTITSVVNAFADNIHWGTIGSGLAKGLNQAVNKIKWKQLGRSISANIRILTDLLYSFVTEFDWANLGKGIGEAVNGWFDGIDFGKLGTTLSEGIKGIFRTVTATLQTVDFGSIGQKLAQFLNNIDIVGILSEFADSVSRLITGLLDLLINFIKKTDWFSLGKQIVDSIVGMIKNIDWKGIVEKFYELLGSAVGGTFSLAFGILQKIWELLKQAWNSVKDYFNSKIEECGGNVVKGIFKGILDAFKNVGIWIKEHIFMPFINGFKNAFGIHSPSREMAEMGGYLIEGLFNAVSDGISKIRGIFEKMLDVIKSVFGGIGNWFKDRFSEAWNAITEIFGNIGGWFLERWNDIVKAFDGIGGWFWEIFTGAWNNITTALGSFWDFFKLKRDEITTLFWGIGGWFWEVFTGAWNNITTAFGCFWDFFRIKRDEITSLFSGIADWFGEKFRNAFDNIKSAFSGIGNFFKNIWEDVSNRAKDGMNWLIGRVEDGINRIVDGLNWLSFDLPDMMGGGHVGFNLNYVSLPRLANGGLATAPTLAMVGDNRNAAADPEVIAPLSKLEGMMGGNSEITELLKVIIELLKSGMNVEIINYMFRNSREFSREVLKVVADDRIRRGGK